MALRKVVLYVYWDEEEKDFFPDILIEPADATGAKSREDVADCFTMLADTMADTAVGIAGCFIENMIIQEMRVQMMNRWEDRLKDVIERAADRLRQDWDEQKQTKENLQ